LQKLSLDASSPAGHKNLLDLLLRQNPDFLDLSEAIKSHATHVNKLIHRFIEKFVTTVERFRDIILNERQNAIAKEGLSDIFKEKTAVMYDDIDEAASFIVIYCDLCADSYFADTKGKILAVLPNMRQSSNFIYVASQIDYIPVDKTLINSISIILANENGKPLNLRPSFTPSYLQLKFKKIIK
jgi:hypothetical protein